MFGYSTPGTYYERVDTGAPAVAPVRVDVAGFVGIARKGPLHTAVPVASWRQFVAVFGDVTPAGYLAYSVRAFFENGGRRCWVVRVSSDVATAARIELLVGGGGGVGWWVSAASPGVWGNDLDVQMRATHRAQTVSVPAQSRPEYSAVTSVTGFQRGSHVRVVDPNGTTLLRVVSLVDPDQRRLYWVNPAVAARLPYDAPIGSLDLNTPLLIESLEYTLVVRERQRLVGVFEGLSLVPEHPQYGPAVLPRLAPTLVAIDERRGPAAIAALAPLDLTGLAIIPLSRDVAGADGLAALQVGDFIGEPVDVLDSDEEAERKRRGLAALDDVREVAAVAIPDIHIQPALPPIHSPLPPCVPDPCLPPPPLLSALPPVPAVGDLPPIFADTAVFRVQSAMVLHCERHADRIAVLDPPFSTVRDPRLGVAAIRAWRRRFDSKYAALYFPWMVVVDPLRNGAEVTRAIPPSGHVTGQYALGDSTVGVHKAPANGVLTWLQDVTLNVDDPTHGLLNDEHIDTIRALPGRGARILGARTLTSDGDFRYVNVRRLLIMIERALDLACKWAVFAPNDLGTRAKLHLSVTSFLLSLWQKGALAGSNPRQAFFVRCNEDTTPAAARDRGELVLEAGIAPSIPFEFVVIRIGRSENQFELAETGSQQGVT
jgi:phage tail sheath protein FI